MAIDFHDLTAVADTLKYVYGSGITNQFSDEKITYHQFPMSDRKPKGLGYVFSMRMARAQGVGSRAESARLPDPLVGKFEQAKILPKYTYGVIRLTGPMIEAAKGDVAAFVDGLSDSVDDIYQSVLWNLNRQSWGDGWGQIGKVSAAATITETAATTTKRDLTLDNDTEVRYLRPGMLIDIYNTAGTALQHAGTDGTSALRIDKIDPVSHKIWLEQNAKATYGPHHPRATSAFTGSGVVNAQTIAANDLIIAMGARDKTHSTASDTPVEMMGLLGIFDDGTLCSTFENVTISSWPQFEANVLSNSSVDRELSLDLMLQAADLTRTIAGPQKLIMRMGLGQRRKYANLLMSDVRFQPTVLKGGYETLSFAAGDGTMEILIDPIAQPGKIFISPSEAVKKYEMTPLGWGNLDQQMHWRSGYDEWDMFLRIYTNLGVEQRNYLTLLKDLVEPSLYT